MAAAVKTAKAVGRTSSGKRAHKREGTGHSAARESRDKSSGSEAKREAALAKANRRRREIGRLKADARSGRIGPAALLADPRARTVKAYALLAWLPGVNLRTALDVLLACQINGARACAELSAGERGVIARALLQIGQATPHGPAVPGEPEGVDRELDRILCAARVHAPSVELAPSEFAAARAGLQSDPVLLRMVDRLVDAVRLYAERDDGGVRARVVAEQWIRFRNYRARVASGEYPPPTQRGPAALE